MTARKITAIHPASASFKDIEELCAFDPTVHACMGYYFRGEISREQALIVCILALAAAKSELQERLIEEMESRPGRWAWPVGQELSDSIKESLDGPRPKTGTGR